MNFAKIAQGQFLHIRVSIENPQKGTFFTFKNEAHAPNGFIAVNGFEANQSGEDYPLTFLK